MFSLPRARGPYQSDSRRVIYNNGDGKSKPMFLLGLLLLAVLMTVSNIRGAVDLLPNSYHEEEAHYHIPPSKLQSPTTSRKDFAIQTRQSSSGGGVGTSSSRSSNKPLLLEQVPSSNNTVVSIISMGKLVDRFALEKCIRSIRVRYIMVFTDDIGYRPYRISMVRDKMTKIIKGRDEDLQPMQDVIVQTKDVKGNVKEVKQQEPKLYAQSTMVFKRFKTHHAKYIAADEALAATTRFVLYVDVDNIISHPLDGLFHDYTTMVQDEHRQWATNLTATKQNPDFSFISMFRDKHLKSKMHSGIIIFDLLHQDGCTDAWRTEMDEFYHVSDQTMLLNVIGNYSAYHCKTFALPHEHFNFASKRVLEERKIRSLPTFVHITDFRVKRIDNATLHQDFLRFILDLKNGETLMTGTTWEQAIAPGASRAAQPPA
ncbi:MAG: hypothetical protein SGARI_003529 [Bacillariaceae sp.]